MTTNPGSRRRSRKGELASTIWGRLYELVLAEHEERLTRLAGEGMTPGEIKALLRLDAAEPLRMRGLAELWRCDATTVTWMVDRLERSGYVERRTPPTDRRVKEVVLTESGQQAQNHVREALYRPPSWIADLSVNELEALERQLDMLDEPE